MFVVELLKKENNSGENGTGGISIYMLRKSERHCQQDTFLNRCDSLLTKMSLSLTSITNKGPQIQKKDAAHNYRTCLTIGTFLNFLRYQSKFLDVCTSMFTLQTETTNS